MPIDKFGRMSDTKTRDTGVSFIYIKNNYILSDGSTPVSGSIDMKGNTLYNVPDLVNPQDVVMKEYAENIRGDGWVKKKQDGTYAIKRDLDMGDKKLKNVAAIDNPYVVYEHPVKEKDKLPKINDVITRVYGIYVKDERTRILFLYVVA